MGLPLRLKGGQKGPLSISSQCSAGDSKLPVKGQVTNIVGFKGLNNYLCRILFFIFYNALKMYEQCLALAPYKDRPQAGCVPRVGAC